MLLLLLALAPRDLLLLLPSVLSLGLLLLLLLAPRDLLLLPSLLSLCLFSVAAAAVASSTTSLISPVSLFAVATAAFSWPAAASSFVSLSVAAAGS